MDRKEFLAQLGLTGATLVFAPCLGGCSKSGGTMGSGGNTPPNKIDFSIDLTDPSYAALGTPGGYVYKDGIIIARTISSQYIAVSAACPHQGTSVVFEVNNDRFFCPNHGSTFTTTGTVTGGPARSNLTKYLTEVNGNLLRVYS